MFTEESIAITVLSLIGKAGVTAAFCGMYVYTSEIYPTEVRNVGLGTCSMVARIAALAGPYVGGLFVRIFLVCLFGYLFNRNNQRLK